MKQGQGRLTQGKPRNAHTPLVECTNASMVLETPVAWSLAQKHGSSQTAFRSSPFTLVGSSGLTLVQYAPRQAIRNQTHSSNTLFYRLYFMI